jgi:hypothetical protein
MSILPSIPCNTTPLASPAPARLLPPHARQQLALDALTGRPVAHLAEEHDVSRKFVYQQVDKAHHALQAAFQPPPDDATVLFHLPVTKAWLNQLTLGLVLICHSSYRGVSELLKGLFDYSLSIAHVHNVVRQAVLRARGHNERQDLSRVRIGTLDELFQARRPVLVGADADTTYCYLLSQEEHRDADTWGVRLLELMERGFAPEATIADGGQGLRAGQKLAGLGVVCRGDVFHPLYEQVGPLVRYLENRAYHAIAARTKLEQEQATFEKRQGRKQRSLVRQVSLARQAEAQAVTLAEDVALLAEWLRADILSVAGPDYAGRCALYDFVVAELAARAKGCPHRLDPVVTALRKQRADLLAFVTALDSDLAALAEAWQVHPATARALLNAQARPASDPRRWLEEAALRKELGGRYHEVAAAVTTLAAEVVRASSVVENLNSRLRNYFFLRRQLGPEYLTLLQFFLNHRQFERSERAERVGQSPAELLTGQTHPHWLEMLGYTRFSQN